MEHDGLGRVRLGWYDMGWPATIIKGVLGVPLLSKYCLQVSSAPKSWLVLSVKWYFQARKTGAAWMMACWLGTATGTRVYSRITGSVYLLPSPHHHLWRRHWDGMPKFASSHWQGSSLIQQLVATTKAVICQQIQKQLMLWMYVPDVVVWYSVVDVTSAAR